MDYYGPMVQSLRFRAVALACWAVASMLPAMAQTPAQSTVPAPPAELEDTDAAASDDAAALNAELFYELLLGEMTTSRGDPGTGYALMLDAARRSGDPQLYRRATEIALQSRSGEYALMAARAWKEALPQSRDANRYMLRILVALNRIGDSAEPLKRELSTAPTRDKISTIRALPQLYGRASDKALAAQVVRQALQAELNHPAIGPIAWTTVGRMDWQPATRRAPGGGEPSPCTRPRRRWRRHAGARAARRGRHAGGAAARGLPGRQAPAEVRMAYARLLLESQRLADAQFQLDAVNREQADMPEAWLLQASLHLQGGRLEQAEEALRRFTGLLEDLPATPQRKRALTQAYLMHAQVAEKRGDYAGAEGWLSRIEDAAELLTAQSRRAALLARQGKLEEARALIRAVPASTPDQERLKLQAEAQLLREAKQYAQAYTVLGKAVALAPADNDLAYDQAMLAEKAGRLDDMERLLRAIIARQPDYHHALNALGFSLAERGVRLEEAKALIVKALEFAPNDPFITDSLGWVEFRLGNRQEALTILKRAYETQPDAEIAAHIGEVLWSLGEHDRARDIWREGLRINKDNDTLKGTLDRLGVRL